MKYVDVIKKLNLLNEILELDFVDLSKLDHKDKVTKEINDEIRQFIESLIEAILSPPKAQIPAQSQTNQFNEQQAMVLGELADKALVRAGIEPTDDDDSIHDDTPPSTPESTESPMMQALRSHGYDPDAPPEERNAIIKKVEKANKGGKGKKGKK